MKLKSHCVETPTELPISRMRVGKIWGDWLAVFVWRCRWDMAYFCAVWPRQGPPAELINGVCDENHCHGGNARRSSGTGIRVWRGSSVIDDCNDDETHRHEQGGDPQRRLAAPALREEEDESRDGEELLGTKETRDEQVLVAATDKELEELRRKVRERCHASGLLTEENAKSDCETLLVRWFQ